MTAATGARFLYANARPQAPSAKLWIWSGAAAVLLHLAAAVPFLAAPPPADEAVVEGPGIGVSLAPIIAPPEPPPAAEPEPEPETPVIEERAEASPPPAPPAKPRETPDLPDIRPRAIPDLWRGSGAGAGSLTLEEYLALEPWLAAARETVLKELSYPVEARKLRLSGAAEVVITADRNGRVVAWSFLSRTGQTLLDREIERSLGRVRRLPRFPDEIAYEQLSFTLPMRFELVFEGRTLAPSDAPPPPASRPAEGQLAAAQLAACAQTAATLTASQTEIAARRAELEALLADYERQARRYERERRDLPVRVRSMLDRYNDGVAGFEQSLTDFEAQAGAFAAACGKGSADWETFRRACAPYADVGNPYCEAFGELWARLRAGR